MASSEPARIETISPTLATVSLTPTLAPTPTPTPTTFLPEPTATPSLEPGRWYWSFDPDSGDILAANRAGEVTIIGTLDEEIAYNARIYPLDRDRALLFTVLPGSLGVYLLDPVGMQVIEMPGSYPYNYDFALVSLDVIGSFENTAVFTYTMFESWGGDRSGSVPRSGPAFLVELSNLTARLVEEQIYNDSFSDSRYLIYPSPDQQYLRYFAGPTTNLMIRELELRTGLMRTIATTKYTPYRNLVSSDGELWNLGSVAKLVNTANQQLSLSDPNVTIFPLDGGRDALKVPLSCQSPCALQLIQPFEGGQSVIYQLPWSNEGVRNRFLVNQLLPDQSLLFTAARLSQLSKPPEGAAGFPALLPDDEPVFRLTPDGQARLIGIDTESEFSTSLKVPISRDNRYILMKSVDQSSYFFYDAMEDRNLFTIPRDPALEYIEMKIRFTESGILFNFLASTPAQEYIYLLGFYSFESDAAVLWDDPSGVFYECTEIIDEDSAVCWVQRPDLDYDLVRYTPGNNASSPLVEGVWNLEY